MGGVPINPCHFLCVPNTTNPSLSADVAVLLVLDNVQGIPIVQYNGGWNPRGCMQKMAIFKRGRFEWGTDMQRGDMGLVTAVKKTPVN